MDFYAYQRPLGRIDDNPDLRAELVVVFDLISKKQAVMFGIAYARHLQTMKGIKHYVEVDQGLAAMHRWLDGTATYHEARSVSFRELYPRIKQENDEVAGRYLRTMAQICAIPHVKFHALWACDFAITLVNRLAPGDEEAVNKERHVQIELLKQFRNS